MAFLLRGDRDRSVLLYFRHAAGYPVPAALLRGCLVFRDSAPLELDDTASSHVQWLCLIVALGALHPQTLEE